MEPVRLPIFSAAPGRSRAAPFPGPPDDPELDGFVEFCLVDLGLRRPTALGHRRHIIRVLEACGGQPAPERIRRFLAGIANASFRNNFVKSLRVYFRDYRGTPELVRTFRLATPEANPPRLFSREELRAFYGALGSPEERALFLFYASTGRRRMEIMALRLGEVDFAKRMLLPNMNSSTKHTWYSFYNGEAVVPPLERIGAAVRPRFPIFLCCRLTRR